MGNTLAIRFEIKEYPISFFCVTNKIAPHRMIHHRMVSHFTMFVCTHFCITHFSLPCSFFASFTGYSQFADIMTS